MPLFALAHAYAFSHKDYIDAFATHAARLPVFYAARDAIGIYDVWTDSITTIRGTGYGYQTFEPSEGAVHAELARARRYKAGLRYAEGGRGECVLSISMFLSSTDLCDNLQSSTGYRNAPPAISPRYPASGIDHL